MSELMNTTVRGPSIRRKLLSTVSASALVVFLGATGKADAASDDADRPTIWIELGGQLEQFAPTEDPFAPPFLLKMPRPSFETIYPLDAERPPRFAIGENAKLTFQPEGSDWVFSAAIRYGRSNGNRVAHQQTVFPTIVLGSNFHLVPEFDNYATTKVKHDENHGVADFQVGKDVGLGMFGQNSTSTVSLGVRFAQFASKTSVDIRERPDLHTNDKLPPPFNKIVKYYHAYHLSGHSERNFHAVGPSLSWNASTPFAGNPESAEFTFDWGVNAAVLFGRQKAKVSHQTTGRYVKVLHGKYLGPPYENSPSPRNSARSVMIPNVGGSAGISLKWPNAKISLGYRADFFFDAVDGGIDKRVSKTLGLNGPYASLSVGIGD